jgi:hypothetical protein
MESKHSPLPWTYCHNGGGTWPIIGERDRATVAVVTPQMAGDDAEHEANAAFIVRACNAHDALVEACEKALFAVQDGADAALHEYGVNAWNDTLNKLREALKAAKGEA